MLILHRCQREVQRRTSVGVPVDVEPFIQVGNFRDGDAVSKARDWWSLAS
jgi:hypothetical protein